MDAMLSQAVEDALKAGDEAEEKQGMVNACKLCAPLGASLAFRGIHGGMPLLHGSQGCATYIRRYMISHFREPIDIASSNFSESAVIFGGASNLRQALGNVARAYHPSVIGVATTCLAETMGDDVQGLLKARALDEPGAPPAVFVNTPSFKGTHAEGYVASLRAIAERFAMGGARLPLLALMPGMVSPEDLRALKALVASFGQDAVMLPDYSETLDGGAWKEYCDLPPGGTTLERLELLGRAQEALELGATLAGKPTAGSFLKERFGVEHRVLPLPLGLKATDALVQHLSALSGHPIPQALRDERSRLLDAYADGHKVLYGIKVAVYGEEDLACAMAGWLAEVGAKLVLVASGGESGRMQAALQASIPGFAELNCRVMQGADFEAIGQAAEACGAGLLAGSSKGYAVAKRLKAPLLRAGFPIHDRFGGGRILHLGYAGALRLFDSLVNLVLEKKQNDSSVGYSYL